MCSRNSGGALRDHAIPVDAHRLDGEWAKGFGLGVEQPAWSGSGKWGVDGWRMHQFPLILWYSLGSAHDGRRHNEADVSMANVCPGVEWSPSNQADYDGK